MTVSKDGARIRGMFAGIARRYDLLNHVLSLNIDRSWRRHAVERLAIQPNERVLDVCTGTGDLAFEIASRLEPAAGGHVVGTDFCREMVAVAEEKRRRIGERRCTLSVGDTLHLPFEEGRFDAITVAFGIRNVSDLEAGLSEMFRVLRPGGRFAILEFAMPRLPLIREAYGFYFRHLLPKLGRWVSREERADEAYSYLPNSVQEFPSPTRLCEILGEVGFVDVEVELLTIGITGLYLGRRPLNDPRLNGGR